MITEDPRAHCKLPMAVGPCEALMRRWYLNMETGNCQQFNYGGCEGNANNFMTREQCEESCTDTCTPLSCATECEYGQKVDEHGCKLCDCNGGCCCV